MTDPRLNLPASQLDLARCADEPIHIPGSIQPHGVLIAAASHDLRITHVSANCGSVVGLTPDEALGQTLAGVFGQAGCDAILGALNQEIYAPSNVLSIVLPPPAATTQSILVHRNGAHIIVEIEAAAPADHENAIMHAQAAVAKLRHVQSLAALCDQAAKEIRALTLYDRVMVYKFDAEDNGDVVAEAAAPELEPFLHLRYPASDIPAQARRLYLLQRIRVIPCVGARPVPLRGNGQLDLSHAALRSISPVHIEYLQNMDVGATLAISIIIDQRLWGMLVCHHRTPKTPPASLRAICDLFGQLLGLLISEAEERRRLQDELRTQHCLAQIAQHLDGSQSIIDGLIPAADAILQLMNATGAYLRLGGKSHCFGVTPPEPVAAAILSMLRSLDGEETMAFEDFALRHPAFASHAQKAAGVLMVPVANNPGDGIVWFRPEIQETVTWGGDPLHKATIDPADGTIRPRASFAAWQTKMRDRAAPWSAGDLRSGQDFRRILTRTLLRHTEAELTRIYNSDPVTGLPNRRVLNQRLATWRGTADRPPAGLLILDLDRFKTVNDSLGHYAGDDLLRAVAMRLAALVGPDRLLVRLSGDEFVIFEEFPNPDAAHALANRVLGLFTEAFIVAGRPHRASASIGVAVSAGEPTDLVREADAAMYAAKRQGGNRVVLFRKTLHHQVLSRLRTEQDLFLALDRHEFILHYQPVIRLRDREVTAFEALARWNHPQRGLLTPNAFIHMAEETGLIGRLGNWVAAEAIRQLSMIDDPTLRMGFNVSAHQLLTGDFATFIKNLLDQHEVPGPRMTVEVTESTLMEGNAVRELQRLRALGCRVAIDDFGTGYSSLSYLRRLPVDTIKIDRSFIEPIGQEPDAEKFLRALIDLAHTLSLRVIAEGIETEAQCDFLTAHGCDVAQGYLFARPRAISEFGLKFKRTATVKRK
jgi:diguanylate cyclase (GGDEF)-like protein